MDTTQFQIIEGTDKQSVEDRVNELLGEGCRVNGGLYAFPYHIAETGAAEYLKYVQSVVWVEKDD